MEIKYDHALDEKKHRYCSNPVSYLQNPLLLHQLDQKLSGNNTKAANDSSDFFGIKSDNPYNLEPTNFKYGINEPKPLIQQALLAPTVESRAPEKLTVKQLEDPQVQLPYNPKRSNSPPLRNSSPSAVNQSSKKASVKRPSSTLSKSTSLHGKKLPFKLPSKDDLALVVEVSC